MGRSILSRNIPINRRHLPIQYLSRAELIQRDIEDGKLAFEVVVADATGDCAVIADRIARDPTSLLPPYGLSQAGQSDLQVPSWTTVFKSPTYERSYEDSSEYDYYGLRWLLETQTFSLSATPHFLSDIPKLSLNICYQSDELCSVLDSRNGSLVRVATQSSRPPVDPRNVLKD